MIETIFPKANDRLFLGNKEVIVIVAVESVWLAKVKEIETDKIYFVCIDLLRRKPLFEKSISFELLFGRG